MTTEDTKKIIAEYAAYLQTLVNDPDGLTGISEDHLTALGTDIKVHHDQTIERLAVYRDSYKIKLLQEAVAPVREQVEAFVESPQRTPIIKHQDESEAAHLVRGTTTLRHSVPMPMDKRDSDSLENAKAALRKQYEGFPEGAVSVGQDGDDDSGLLVTAMIDLSKAGVMEAAKDALAKLNVPKASEVEFGEVRPHGNKIERK